MRPHSITLFDRFFLGALVLGLINAALSFQDNMAMLGSTGTSTRFLVSITLFSLGIPLLLWFFISRRASNMAKWILAVLTGLGLVSLLPTLSVLMARGLLSLVFTVTITALQVVAVAFLFRKDARAWFAGKGTPGPEETTIFE
ncbi:MAG: hypothetical protein P8Y58_00685 [Novosphingobium sp.]